MTEQETIRWQNAFRETYKGMPEKLNKEANEACDTAISALEKQIPKKPTVTKYYYFCPECGTRRSIKQKHNFCHDCGQAIDWSDKDETN
ncbi:MAG: hypothetical protein J6B68_01770 [Lachnospiraceae bacterium]|nr:hypothetical protein [Lachnospiraceae bacterium]MBP3477575.1 hypothetical protein [Lachnospiraceae bacterium]